jgi:hypothetical protein
MRILYRFNLSREIESEEIQLSKDADGKEIKTLVKVKKQEPYTFFVAKPGRKLTEDSELFYNSVYWDAVKKGIMPATQLQKRLINDGGVLSDEQSKEYKDAYDKLFSLQSEHRVLNSKTDKTEEEKKTVEKLMEEMIEILTKIQNFENKTGSELYQNTAENLSRNRTSLWWTLMLSHEEKDGKEIPYFGPGSYEDKLKVYDSMEEKEDVFEFEIIKKLLLTTSLWYFGKAQTQEDFDVLLKLGENQDLINASDIIAKEDKKQEEKLEVKSEDKLEFKKQDKDSKEGLFLVGLEPEAQVAT